MIRLFTYFINSIKGILYVQTNLPQLIFFPKKILEEQRIYLNKRSYFYSCLNSKDKIIFEHRVYKFIKGHNFIGNEIEITLEMKTLIAAMATTLTFGMHKYLFSQVDSIIIYPESYYSTVLKQMHKGETNPKLRLVVFSWMDFLDGVKVKNDNLNLALHEFSHALHFGFLINQSYSGLNFKNYYNKILIHLKNKDNQKKIIDANYLREYAFENQYEFLAVLIEHYFETPEIFKEKLPIIFMYVQKMLNIDILKIYKIKY